MAKEHNRSQRRRYLSRFLISANRRFKRDPNLPSPPLTSMLATWVGIGSAVIGGFIGLDTYRSDVDKKADQNVAESFDMVKLYNSEQMAKARSHVMSYVYARRACDSRIVSDDLVDQDYAVVIDFFDLAYACVEANLCDREASEDFFSPYANYQWPILEKVVANFQSQEQSFRADSNFGKGLEAFALNPIPAPPCDGNF